MITLQIEDLRTLVVQQSDAPQTLVILLHGYAMEPEDLAPFGRSIGVPAWYLFPQGPIAALPAGHAWWQIDHAAREAARLIAPRDLAGEVPAGLPAAREQLERFVTNCRARFQPQRLIVGGFSQGGMLTCDWQLHSPQGADALLLLSASRLNAPAWQARAAQLKALPVLISHGERDTDLAFAAGEQLRAFVEGAGAQVSWTAFAGGHEIPLAVWRAVRRFLFQLVM